MARIIHQNFYGEKTRERMASGGSVEDLLKLAKTDFKVNDGSLPFSFQEKSTGTVATNYSGFASDADARRNTASYATGGSVREISAGTDTTGFKPGSYNAAFMNKEIQSLLPLFKKRIAEYQISQGQPGVRSQTRNT
jgi:hypothetical protein